MTAALLIGLLACAPPAEAPYDPSWTLVWSDEFDGPAGSPPSDVWVPDIGAGGWGNEQLEYNTDDPDNASLDGEGHLAITARREARDGAEYTSARLTTAGRYTHGPGRFEAVMQLPAGTGLWPAFWMLGEDYPTVGWPNCGEIDILELRGEEPDTANVAIHGPGYSGGGSLSGSLTLTEGTFADDFHTFAVDVDPDHLTFWVDDRRVRTVRPGDLPGGAPWVFDESWFLLLNLAVGGTYLAEPDDTTPFPATVLVDAVRVYERETP